MSWRQADGRAEAALRERLARALADPAGAGLQDRLLWDLLRALGVAHRVMRPQIGAVTGRQLEARLESYGAMHPIALVLRGAAQEYEATLIAATT